MKKINLKLTVLIIVLILSGISKNIVNAQAPKVFKYEFLVRTYNGDIAANKNVNMRVSILDGSANGNIVYSETQNNTIDRFGMITLEIGNGTDKSGEFKNIDWSKGDYYLKMDELGGKNFLLMPTFQLLSVPFALYADKAANVDDADADPRNELQVLSYSNDTLYLSNGGFVNLSYADNQTLSFHDDILFIKNGNNVRLPLNFSDTSAMNELQTISKLGDTIVLSNGGGLIIDENTIYSSGEGIAINETEIINTAPSRWTTNNNNVFYNNGSAGLGTNNPENSAILDVASNTKGFLPPRMTTAERNAIVDPANGLIVFNTDKGCINFFSGTNWVEICGSCTPQPTKADAGPDQLDMSGTSTTLSANQAQIGEGTWSIVNGERGSFADAKNPKSNFSGISGVTYELRWSISNPCGTSTDKVIISFWSCGYPLTDFRDGKNYTTIEIGSQCWLAENINVGTMINGANNQSNNNTIEKYCYDDNASNCDEYGALYQWDEMMQYSNSEGSQGICPNGWHIPSDNDWKTLEIELGMAQAQADQRGLRGDNQGDQIKEGGTSGFNALHGGSRLSNGLFYAINNYGNFWSSSEVVTNAWRHGVSNNSQGIYRTQNEKLEGISVRCVKN
ncbi:MAG: hypothetical protein K8R58_05555 [Bacteroidales bacterium]|nr:hypothetical protein [Bacteroidales bacterium]